MNFHPPFSEPPCFFSFFLIPQILIGSNTLLQKFTPRFKILDPRLVCITWLQFCHKDKDFNIYSVISWDWKIAF